MSLADLIAGRIDMPFDDVPQPVAIPNATGSDRLRQVSPPVATVAGVAVAKPMVGVLETSETCHFKSVSPVEDVATENPATPATGGLVAPADSPRWHGFITLCQRLGLHADMVREYFTGHAIADLIVPEHDDAVLAACARTIADAIGNEQVSASVDQALHESRQAVQCAECRHFVQRVATVGYGTCAAGIPSTGATVLHFAMHRHPCGKFENAQ